MNAPPHDPLLCGLDWESTCKNCRTLFPQYVDRGPPTNAVEEAVRGAPTPAKIVWVGLDYDEITERSPLAFKVLCSDGRALWIPFSQIENQGSEYGLGFRNGTMMVTAWIARQKGINEGSQEPERPPEEWPQDDQEFDQYDGYDFD